MSGLNFIYQITNKVNGCVYVGETSDPKRRWYQHLYTLRNGISHHKRLQADYDEHGEDVFEFEVIDKAPDDAVHINKVPFAKTLNMNKIKPSARRAYNRLQQIRNK